MTINSPIPILTSERLILKPLTIEHCSEIYVDWMNDPLVTLYLESGGNYTIEMLREYILSTVSKKTYFWAIHLRETGKHIGNIKIDPINTRHLYGEYGILMGDKGEWGKGYAKEASITVIDFCFEHLKLRKVNLGVVEKNISAVNLYKNLGFIQEGLFYKHGYYDGDYQNLIRMAIFNKQFFNK